MAGPEDKHARSADALRELARTKAGGDGDCPAPAGGAGVEDAGEALAGLVDVERAPMSPAAQAAARAANRRNASRANTRDLRRLMVPLLVIVGAVLLLFSAATAVMLIRGPQGQQETMLDTYGPMLILLSCPLSALLLGGAWWFHLEAARTGDD